MWMVKGDTQTDLNMIPVYPCPWVLVQVEQVLDDRMFFLASTSWGLGERVKEMLENQKPIISSSIHCLQIVQNLFCSNSHQASAKADRDYISPVSLAAGFFSFIIPNCHNYKIQPAYIVDLCAPYILPRSKRFSDKHLLTVPDIYSEMGHGSNSFNTATIWNSFPQG